MKNYTVIVGNIGNVLETNSLKKAQNCFNKFVEISKIGKGSRAKDENVCIMNNKYMDIEKEYIFMQE